MQRHQSELFSGESQTFEVFMTKKQSAKEDVWKVEIKTEVVILKTCCVVFACCKQSAIYLKTFKTNFHGSYLFFLICKSKGTYKTS